MKMIILVLIFILHSSSIFAGFTPENQVDHDNLLNFLSAEHFTEGTIDHGNITGLGDGCADHVNLICEDGVSGGQTLIGGTGAGDSLLFQSTSNATKGVIDFGTLTAITGIRYDEVNDRLTVHGTNNTITIGGVTIGATLMVHNNAATDATDVTFDRHATGASLSPTTVWARSDGTEAAPTIVLDGDQLGLLGFVGFDGTDYETAATIKIEVDGAPGNNDMPGVMTFNLTPDGSAVVVERMRIDNAGLIGIGTPTAAIRLQVDTSAASTTAIQRWENTASDADLFLSTATPEGATTGNIGDVNIDTASGIMSIKKTTGGNTGWDDLVSLAATQTLTNKTINDPTNDVDADRVHTLVRNISGLLISKCQPVFNAGYNAGQDRTEIELAEADVQASMDAIGLVENDIANNANGEVVAAGKLMGCNTSSFAVGDDLYVSATAGTLTNARPSVNGDLVQIIGKVGRSHATLGVINVFGANRANAIPNNLTMINTGMFRTGTTAADTATFAAFDVDGAAYTIFGTLTANNTPTLDLQPTTLSLPSFTQGSVFFTGASGAFTEDNANLFWDDTGNRLGIGTATPDRILHSELADAATATVSYPLRLTHITSGTAAASFGVGLGLEVESGSGNNVVSGAIESVLSSATDGAEESNLVFKTIDIGDDGLATRMTINKDGNVGMAMNPLSSVGLSVSGPTGSTGLITVADTSSAADWLTLLATTAGNPAIFWESSGDLRLGTGTSPSGSGFVERARLTNGSLFGIGITPTTALHIDSNAADTTAIATLENTSGNCQIFRIDGSTPEGSITGSRCDLAAGIVAGEGVLYIKEKGDASNTGWKIFETAHYANMLVHANAVATDINTVNIAHFVQGLFADEISEDFTFAAGSTGPISAFADAGGGQVTVTDTAHGLATGDIVSISGTTSYNGVFAIANSLTNTYEITDTFVADDATGNWYKGDSVTADVGSAGVYKVTWSAFGLTAGNNKDFLVEIFKNAIAQNTLDDKRRFQTTTDIGSINGGGIITIADGDIITFSLTGLTDTTNFTFEHISLSLHKL